ncbi:MAG: hypothetical protein HYU52_07305 [Acidobacteria bacterium]|nr:hypothetical protein [Acidobacteriota bacterium]
MMTEQRSDTSFRGLGWACSGVLTRRDAENLRRFNVVTLAWAMMFVASTLAIVRFGAKGLTGWALATATLLLGVVAMALYVKFLRAADELLRKIHVEALGLGFGASIVFMLFWRLCERLGAPKLDVVDPVLVMVLFWAAGQYIGLRRYRGESGE